MIHHLDHLVLTTADEQACIDFYVGLLGMTLETFGQGRKAFKFGGQKINLHVKGSEFEPKAHLPVPGALDLCFIAARPLGEVIARIQRTRRADRRGPGAAHRAPATRCAPIYLRDPDLNLIEISERAEA
ncbi:lactoylglutathione lyase [Alicycliphilus sp. B1]|nr:lactoylglutathione lyase [Alicycliphilus sp. B1]